MFVDVPQAALRLGLSHAPLATAALDALESWSSQIPPSILQPHYMDILPHLDGYLKTNTSNGERTRSTNINYVKGPFSIIYCVYSKRNRLYTISNPCQISAVSDKDESSMNVTFVSSGTAKGYGKIMMRLLQKSKHLPMVTLHL